MKFEEVLPALEEGKIIRRQSWTKIINLYTTLRREDVNPEYYYDFIVDQLANDWEIINDSKLETTESNNLLDDIKEVDWREKCIYLEKENQKLRKAIAGLEYALYRCSFETNKED